jgi:hypothetical protein
MKLAALFLLSLPLHAQQAEIERALIQRDRQSAEFARPELRELHQRQDTNRGPLRPDERVMQARERDAYPATPAPAPIEVSPYSRPLPLPGGPRPLVDPVPVQGVGP